MKKIRSFREFINEQSETPEVSAATGADSAGTTPLPGSKPETEREKKSRIAASLVKSLFGNLGDLSKSIDANVPVTKEIKESLPYKGCGATTPYPLQKNPISVKTFKILLDYLQAKGAGSYSRAIKDLEEKRSVIIGVRNKLDVKKDAANQDRFTDALYLIPQNAKDEDILVPYQITTSPSLSYFGDNPINPKGTGIKLPGDTLYYLREASLPHGTYKMMVEGESIKVGRFPVGVKKFETYKPVDTFTENTGMHIHRSSTKGEGICIGPWSAGCQVFSDGDEFKDFISKAEQQTINNNRFYYALIELDSIPNDVMQNAMKGISTQPVLASTETPSATSAPSATGPQKPQATAGTGEEKKMSPIEQYKKKKGIA